MARVQEAIDVAVPIRVAYDQWTQFETFPQFMGGVERITQLDDTHTHWVTNIDGVKREFDAEITEQHPEERVAWTSTGGEAKHAGAGPFHPPHRPRARASARRRSCGGCRRRLSRPRSRCARRRSGGDAAG